MLQSEPAPPSASDPLAELMAQLMADGQPALHWVVQWSRDGGDPVEAAWAISRDPVALVRALAVARRQPEAVVLESVLVASRFRRGFVWVVDDASGGSRLVYGGVSPEGACASIRQAIDAPPTLDQIIEGMHGR
jgi:hypothetical protein